MGGEGATIFRGEKCIKYDGGKRELWVFSLFDGHVRRMYAERLNADIG